MSEHKPDPEFVAYLENQVKNPNLSAITVLRMERVFIDQREKYEAMLQAARQSECDCCGYPGHDLPKWRKVLQEAARQSEGGEAVGFIPSSGLNNLKAGHPARIYPVGSMPSPFEASTLVYTTPQPDKPEWIRCEDRLPEPRSVSRTSQNGILVKFDSGRITQFREVSETLISNMRNGPRRPMKFESPSPARIVEWMDLDAYPTPPADKEPE